MSTARHCDRRWYPLHFICVYVTNSLAGSVYGIFLTSKTMHVRTDLSGTTTLRSCEKMSFILRSKFLGDSIRVRSFPALRFSSQDNLSP
jgi:hypothetical protein